MSSGNVHSEEVTSITLAPGIRSSVAVCLVALVCAGRLAAEAPYPAALERSAVTLATLATPIDDAIILGNGDLNALVFAEGDDVVVRITKNDVWDARLDTTLDPPLPTLARLKELGAGPWPDSNWILPEGVTPPAADSYHAHPYPCPRICGVLRLIGAAKPPLIAKLDLARAELVLHSSPLRCACGSRPTRMP